MSDICEGSSVYKCRRVLQGLHQIRLQRVLQQRCRRSLCPDVRHSNRCSVICIPQNNPGKFILQIFYIMGETKNRHDLAGHRNLESVFPRNSAGLSAHSVQNMAELTVIHIHSTFPCDSPGINVQRISLLNVVVQHGSDQIVRSADGVHVSGKVQIDILHRDHLGVASARRSAFDAEHGAQRRLPQRQHHLFVQSVKSVRKSR